MEFSEDVKMCCVGKVSYSKLKKILNIKMNFQNNASYHKKKESYIIKTLFSKIAYVYLIWADFSAI